MSNTYAKVVTAVTANTSVTFPGFNGALITNRGAGGAITLTLDDPTTANAGCWCEIFIVADQSVTLRAVSASKMTVFNNAAATSIAWTTASNKIGSGCKVTCDGTTWLVQLNPGTTSGAATAATLTIA